MICFPNAKINIGLNVVSKRADGYHNLETIFYPIALKDVLEITPSTMDKDSFSSTGIPLACAFDDNLICKVLRHLRRDYDIPYIDIHFIKKIPFGAGLGGGSSDAAFMLKLLNDVFLLGFTTQQLCEYASKIGADCPFFISNSPAYATGIGNELELIDLDLSKYYLVLIKPPFSVSTREAYSKVVPRESQFSLKEISSMAIGEWKEIVKNDFENSVFEIYPQIGNIKNELYRQGALYASMSGSGSSVFAFFDDRPTLKKFPEEYFIWRDK